MLSDLLTSLAAMNVSSEANALAILYLDDGANGAFEAARAGVLRFRRREDEAKTDFHDRVLEQALAADAPLVIFGGMIADEEFEGVADDGRRPPQLRVVGR